MCSNVKSGGLHNPVTVYDEDYIRNRSRLIMYGIDARRQRYPDETPYRYAPLAEEAETYRWTPGRQGRRCATTTCWTSGFRA